VNGQIFNVPIPLYHHPYIDDIRDVAKTLDLVRPHYIHFRQEIQKD